MKKVTIYFNDGDVIELDCMDMAINNGFLTIFLPQQSIGEKTTIKTVQAYNAAQVESWTFEQKDEKGEDA